MRIYRDGNGITRLFISRAFVREVIPTHYRPYRQQRSHHYVPIAGNLRVKRCVEGWVPYKESWLHDSTRINHVYHVTWALSAAIGYASLFRLDTADPSAPRTLHLYCQVTAYPFSRTQASHKECSHPTLPKESRSLGFVHGQLHPDSRIQYFHLDTSVGSTMPNCHL